MPRGGARGQNLGFFFVESFVFEQQVLLRLNLYISLFMISDCRVLLAQSGAKGQNLEHLNFFFLFVFRL